MAGIFTRNALHRIMEDESLTPQQRTEQVYRLYGLALEDGYVSKAEAQRAREEGVAAPDPKESDEYKKAEEFVNDVQEIADNTKADIEEHFGSDETETESETAVETEAAETVSA